MKLFYAPYQLLKKGCSGFRSGALLKAVFGGDKIGYADCHPWPELGDYPLNVQLELLSKQITTSLTKQSLQFAKIDADARQSEIHLFEGLIVPPSHYLLNSFQDEIPEGFVLCKLKLGKEPQYELKNLTDFFLHLPQHIRVRFDFNNRIDKTTFLLYLKCFEPYFEKIDFIEDPFPYDLDEWEKIQRFYPVKLALDRHEGAYKENVCSFAVRIQKPAVQQVDLSANRNVITSYLDHPLGQMAASYTASLLKKEAPEKILSCGLLSHTSYHTNKYSERFKEQGDQFCPPKEGFGFGFDSLLIKENWIIL